jgi:hypothetical protein
MKHHVLLTLILFGLLSGSTMTFTPATYAATIGTRPPEHPPSACILPKVSNTIHGTLAGTQVSYTITMPTNWNGTLLLFSHMYVSPLDAPLNPAPVATDSFTADALVKTGYALAGSSYGHGWAVQEAFQDQIALLDLFKSKCGSPIRTIAWGQSLGGLVTAGLAQLYPTRFAGALPMCGVVAGSVGTWNQLLDAAFAFNVLLAGNKLPLVHIPLTNAQNIINQATSTLTSAQSTAQGRARTALTAALSDVPGWYNLSSPEPNSQDFATQEHNQFLWESQLDFQFAFGARIELELRAGGNPSWNTGIDYGKQLAQSSNFKEVVALYKQAGLNLDQDLNSLAKAPRIKADPKAVDYLGKYFTVNGNLSIPVLTMHTTGDGLAVNQDEQLYASLANAKGKAGMLRQIFVHRADHCSFTPAEILAGFQTLINRVNTGTWGNSTDPAQMIKKATAFGSFLNPLPPSFLNFKPTPFLRPLDTPQ